jgi:hypothetical protein
MDRFAALQKYQDIVACSYVRSNARDRQPASAVKGIRRGPCWHCVVRNFSEMKQFPLLSSSGTVKVSVFCLLPPVTLSAFAAVQLGMDWEEVRYLKN